MEQREGYLPCTLFLSAGRGSAENDDVPRPSSEKTDSPSREYNYNTDTPNYQRGSVSEDNRHDWRLCASEISIVWPYRQEACT